MPIRHLIVLAALALALSACSHAPPRNPMAQWVPSPNFSPRQPVLIVIHATEQESVQESLDTLRTENSGGPVSSHYLVGDNGDIYQLVADQNRAWHAGPGRWGTITDVNSASIGIELDNNGEEPFAPAQIDSLLRLLDDLCERHGIPRTAIVAHADFAPTRKRDPGFRFPWKQLADAGFGLWPDEPLADPPPGFDPWQAMRLLGYPLELDDNEGHPAIVRAFHRRFRGDEGGVLDEQDARILYSLTQSQVGAGSASLDVLDTPDPSRTYLIYLHGRAVENHGRRPSDPRFGVYDYPAVLEALASRGAEVVSAQRPADTDVDEYAGVVVAQVERLIEAGVPADQIAVVGFSKGGDIAIRASNALWRPEVRFALLAACWEREDDARLRLTGRVLSIRESSDTLADRSCRPLAEQGERPASFEELQISTGRSHGAFYEPLPEWLDPLLAWVHGEGGT